MSASTYEYDEDAASHADDFANRIDESALYIGEFKRVSAVLSKNNTQGMSFDFEVEGGGKTNFTLWTEKEDGTRIFGFNKVQAMMTIFGLKSLRAEPGKVEVWDEEEGKRVEADGEVYPALQGKLIGCALEKELYTSGSGKDSYRMNLAAVFHPVNKLTASEIRERKVKPEKIEKIQKGLRTRDNREKRTPEPGQPGAGAPVPTGEY